MLATCFFYLFLANLSYLPQEIKPVAEPLTTEQLDNYRFLFKNNCFSQDDLSKIADEKKTIEDFFLSSEMQELTRVVNEGELIEDFFLFARDIAKKMQPKWSMCNLITLPQQKKPDKVFQQYLVSSAPTTSEGVSLFWENVLKSGSRIIVSVLQAEENGIIKSLPYWNTDAFKINNITKIGETVLQSGVKNTNLIRREFLVKSFDDTVYIIQQFHYDGWPDFCKAPDMALFSRLLQEVRTKDDGTYPVTVHCAKGVGRSSAFVFSYFLYKKMLEKNNIPQQILNGNLNMALKKPKVRKDILSLANGGNNTLKIDEPTYNLLGYIFEGMCQRKDFGSRRQLTTIIKGALEAFNQSV